MRRSWSVDRWRPVLPIVLIYSVLGLGGSFYYPYLDLQAQSLGLTVNQVWRGVAYRVSQMFCPIESCYISQKLYILDRISGTL